MIVPASAFATALHAMRMQVRKLDRAAESIASAGLDLKTTGPPAAQASAVTPPPESNNAELAVSMNTMLTAQRSFLAQQRVMEAAEVLVGEATKLQAGAPKG